ncbi:MULTISPECIES: 2-oxo acid dehydrogenase subunit E2 [Peribacillus]|nr:MULTISPECIES: 2-oxo acid dehydrogenase subunit E2 [unclassified Peribacillus]MCK1983448.1 2-oxo acid dehydrogenase subunit E2 [Peribacillus sp. Aquil_B1]MCK2006466.1 2-oxo acid dehydrogenase subunit E2 [Peribacillus sp. Aquil_B8]
MFVPVINRAEEKPIKEIAKDVRELVKKVRTD